MDCSLKLESPLESVTQLYMHRSPILKNDLQGRCLKTIEIISFEVSHKKYILIFLVLINHFKVFGFK